MKSWKKYSIIITMSILFTGILFVCNPKFWLKIVNPFEYEVVGVDSRINEGILTLQLHVVMSNDYFLPIILDRIHYEIKMDRTHFSEGEKIFDKAYSFAEKDTISVPLIIDLKTIREVIASNQNEDSLLLEINFTNYIELPIAGETKFSIPLKKMISRPNPPKFNVLKVEKELLKMHDARFKLHFEIDNPNHYQINVQSVQADLIFPDLFTGKINCSEGFVVQSNSKKRSSAEIDIDNLELVRDGLKVLFRPNKEWDYELDVNLVLLKEDSTEMLLRIRSTGQMPLKKRQ